MTDIITAIRALDPNAHISVNAEDIGQITWYDGNPTNITQSQIIAKRVELQAAEPMRLLRIERNRILAETDWRDLPSYAGTKQAEWRTYRQELRDLTTGLDTVEKVNAVTWPEKPE
jgi:hypothetical protein